MSVFDGGRIPIERSAAPLNWKMGGGGVGPAGGGGGGIGKEDGLGKGRKIGGEV